MIQITYRRNVSFLNKKKVHYDKISKFFNEATPMQEIIEYIMQSAKNGGYGHRIYYEGMKAKPISLCLLMKDEEDEEDL